VVDSSLIDLLKNNCPYLGLEDETWDDSKWKKETGAIRAEAFNA